MLTGRKHRNTILMQQTIYQGSQSQPCSGTGRDSKSRSNSEEGSKVIPKGAQGVSAGGSIILAPAAHPLFAPFCSISATAPSAAEPCLGRSCFGKPYCALAWLIGCKACWNHSRLFAKILAKPNRYLEYFVCSSQREPKHGVGNNRDPVSNLREPGENKGDSVHVHHIDA